MYQNQAMNTCFAEHIFAYFWSTDGFTLSYPFEDSSRL